MIARDKLLHFAAGVVITLIVGWLLTPIFGFAACLVAAWAKEYLDAQNPERTSDGWDAFATLCGALPALALLSIITLH